MTALERLSAAKSSRRARRCSLVLYALTINRSWASTGVSQTRSVAQERGVAIRQNCLLTRRSSHKSSSHGRQASTSASSASPSELIVVRFTARWDAIAAALDDEGDLSALFPSLGEY